MPTIIESNCETGEVTEREMTPEEIAAAQAAKVSEHAPTAQGTTN